MFQPNILAQNIKSCRKKLGITQQELADKLFVSGQAISKWESGISTPDIHNLCLLADIFLTSVDKLIGSGAPFSESRVFIGIDGGATKTEFVLITQKGAILNRLCLSGCNPNVCGIEQACHILSSGIDALCAIRPDVSGVFAGIAGCMSGNNKMHIDRFFAKQYPLLKIKTDSDISNVIWSVPKSRKCIAMICGTGFAMYASDGEKLHRVGAWGYLLDNIGGGFGIGREALRAALAQRDGFGRKTQITERIEAILGTSVWQSIDKIYQGGDAFIASFAPVVFEAYENGDAVAAELLDKHADAILEMLDFSFRTYDCGNSVIASGGLIANHPMLLSLLKQKAGDAFRFTIPQLPQIFGACFRACSLFGTPDEEFTMQFQKDYRLQGESTWKSED